jgi:hypothetical protein
MNRLLTAALALAAVLASVPASAQPFRSDTRGPDVTGSGIARYPSLPTRDLEGALFRQVGERTAFRSSRVADAVLNEAAAAERAACAGTLQHPRQWPDSLRADSASQRLVCGLLRRPGLTSEEARVVLEVLRGSRAGRPGDAAETLVAALAGLTAAPPASFPGPRGRQYVDGSRWDAAVRAYDAFLAAAPDELMADPPAVLVAIGIVLNRVVAAGLAASER